MRAPVYDDVILLKLSGGQDQNYIGDPFRGGTLIAHYLLYDGSFRWSKTIPNKVLDWLDGV